MLAAVGQGRERERGLHLGGDNVRLTLKGHGKESRKLDRYKGDLETVKVGEFRACLNNSDNRGAETWPEDGRYMN